MLYSDRGWEGVLTAAFLFAIVSYGAAAVALALRGLVPRRAASAAVAVVALFGPAVLLDWRTGAPLLVAALGLLSLVTLAASWRVLADLTLPGRMLVTAALQATLVGLAWGVWFIVTLPVSTPTRPLLLAGFPLVLLAFPVTLVQSFETLEVLLRGRWRRPRAPLPAGSLRRYPKVAIHVPTCSEPPAVVLWTLNALSCLRYPNFEVLVVDNNTKEERLWRPVAAYCRHLGERFRFLHVDELAGAKAGALNLALQGPRRPDPTTSPRPAFRA